MINKEDYTFEELVQMEGSFSSFNNCTGRRYKNFP